MKKMLLGMLLTLCSLNVFATPVGAYKNVGESEEPFFRSVEFNSKNCKKGGFIAKFYAAEPFNFCTDYKDTYVFKTTRCVGKTLPYPFNACVGIKVKQVFTTVTEVQSVGNSQSFTKKSYTDDTLTHEEEYKITEINDAKVELEYSFKNIDGRSNDVIYTYEKQ
jgi:hypothetical protein